MTINANPAHVVNTWSHYIHVVNDHTLLIPSAGMHSIENDFPTDNHLTIAVGSYQVPGTDEFQTSGAYFDVMKAQFDWIRAVLVVHVDDIEQKI